MATVIVSPFQVASFPEGGGHFWVYMQYVQSLRRLGCDAWWLEQFSAGQDPERDAQSLSTFFRRMERFGMGRRVLLYTIGDGPGRPIEFLHVPAATARAVLQRAELLLNFHYGIDPRILAAARRTALIDIDPGLTQIWIGTGQIQVPQHDTCFSIGETVGTRAARFPDCGLMWRHIRPPVCLELWPAVAPPRGAAFTTVAGWWSGKWVRTVEDAHAACEDNNKRVSFLAFRELPRLTSQPLELALHLARGDGADRSLLEGHGWNIRPARDVAGTPERYQAYIRASRGEWSCAKPFFVRLRTAWVSDRTVCYLASGKPAVVQHTGPSSYLPSGTGLFRFTTLEEAATALDAINADYPRHCRAAREIAEAYFDGRRIVAGILDQAISPAPRPPSPASRPEGVGR